MTLKGNKTRILNGLAVAYILLPMFGIDVPQPAQAEITAGVLAVLNIINREFGTSTVAGSDV